MKSITSFANGLASKYFNKRTVTFNLPQSVVSFSFDDFPRSALDNGGSILEAHNVRGTFYVSAGLGYTSSSFGLIAGQADWAACTKRGHELGCHSYDHIDCTHHSYAQISASIKKNQEAIRMMDSTFEHFAYPYGRLSLAAKKAALRYYKSARGIQRGINREIIDLGLLKANALYLRFTSNLWHSYLHDLATKPGWLILYTHDVSESPSDYGCTPQELESVVTKALRMGYDVLPIGEVVGRLTK